MKMKGQFFIVAAILLVSLFFMGLPKQAVFIGPQSEDLPYLYKNVETELPRALNYGLREDRGIPKLVNFTNFVSRIMDERNVNLTVLWLVTSNVSSNLNITGGNFLKYNLNVTVNVSGSAQNLSLPYNTTNSTLFTSVSQQFNITIAFSGNEKTATWQRDKVNFYAYIKMERDEDVITDQITG